MVSKYNNYNREIELGIRKPLVKQTFEHKKKRLSKLRGRIRSEETKKKISETIKNKGGLIPKGYFDLKNIDRKCQICGDRFKLLIHHVDGNKANNSLNNLALVCSYCHHGIHHIGKLTRFKEGHKTNLGKKHDVKWIENSSLGMQKAWANEEFKNKMISQNPMLNKWNNQ
jgi:hypothetical protein